MNMNHEQWNFKLEEEDFEDEDLLRFALLKLNLSKEELIEDFNMTKGGRI